MEMTEHEIIDLIKGRVRELYNDCVKKGMNPYETAMAIDRVIGGLTKVDYDANKGLKLHNHRFSVGIHPEGLSRKESRMLEDLVLLAHHVLSEKDRSLAGRCDITLGKKKGTVISTKHYRKEFDRYAYQRILQYV